MRRGDEPPRLALVLAGGAARGAYEVGVLRYLFEELARDLEVPFRPDILCGTSVGAINACMLASRVDDLAGAAAGLSAAWTGLGISDALRPDGCAMLSMLLALLGGGGAGRAAGRHGGVLESAPIDRLIVSNIPFARIHEHIRAGRLAALTVSTTQVATGRTVVFVERTGVDLPAWSSDPSTIARPTTIAAAHARASAAIPFLFPAVEIDGELHCDGGLRQNVPLSPARRLGADGMVVINPRYLGEQTPSAGATVLRERSLPDPVFLLGKTLNALLLDRMDADLQRLELINEILRAGHRRFGPRFTDSLNSELGQPPASELRIVRSVLIRASQDLGRMAADYVRAPAFAKRARGATGRVLRRLADGEARSEADLLSYLLFDGPFAADLIELGRCDARAQHAELCRFFSAAPEQRVALARISQHP